MRLFTHLCLLFVIAISLAWRAQFHAVSSTDTQVFSVPRSAIRPLNQEQTNIYIPGDTASLQDAIRQVADGGTIELASGTYLAPENGLIIHDLGKAFTIRAEDGATVVLSGGGDSPILVYSNSDISKGKPVVFENLVFANGLSTTDGIAAGVTMVRAQATFVNVTFRDNHGNEPNTGSGGIAVAFGSTAFFINTTFSGNTARNYGAGLSANEGTVYIHNSRFLNNRTNLPGHLPSAAGGGIHAVNSSLRVTNSYFEGNQAGYVGGAIYTLGTWMDPVTTPHMDVIVVNSTFVNNVAARDASVSYHSPTEGGAFHAEDQTYARIFNSRFITNRSNIGGAVNLYRAKVEVDGCVFQGNQANGIGSANGFGAAISATSNDGLDSSIAYGAINRPPAHLTVTNSYIQGRYGNVGVVSQNAGGIYSAGDSNRTFGLNGLPRSGSPEENRAVVVVQDVIFNDLDVQEIPNTGGTGAGGAILVDHVDLSLSNSLVMNSDALGIVNSSGGGLTVLRQSLARVSETTFARNTSEKYGGALFIQGSTLNMSSSNLIENEIKNTNYGSAIFASPMDGTTLNVDGVVENCLLSNNKGLPIFDDDRAYGPINDVRYNGNRIFHGNVDGIVYSDSLPGYSWKTVQELNNMVVVRANGTSTDKSQVANTPLDSPAITGALLAAPSKILADTYPAYLAYAWSGSSATLDGVPVSGNAGVSSTTQTGNHTLSIANQSFTDVVGEAPTPQVLFSATNQGSDLTLSWEVLEGSFLDAAIDQGVSIPPTPSGSVQISADVPLNYRFYTITKEGGMVKSVNTAAPLLYAPSEWTVLTGLNLTTHIGYLPIYNLGGNFINWTAQTSTPDLIQIVTPSGQIETSGTVIFTIDVDGRDPGVYTGSIDIDAGDAGSENVTLLVHIYDVLHHSFLPILTR